MNKRDIIIAAVIAGGYITEIIFAGKAGAIIGLVNFLCGGATVYYILMRRGVLG